MKTYTFYDTRAFAAEPVADAQLSLAMRGTDCTADKIYSRMAIEIAARRLADPQPAPALEPTFEERIWKLLFWYENAEVSFKHTPTGHKSASMDFDTGKHHINCTGSSEKSLPEALNQLETMLCEMVEGAIL